MTGNQRNIDLSALGYSPDLDTVLDPDANGFQPVEEFLQGADDIQGIGTEPKITPARYFGFETDDQQAVGKLKDMSFPYLFGADGIFYFSKCETAKDKSGKETSTLIYGRMSDFFTVYGSGVDPLSGLETLVLCHFQDDTGRPTTTAVPRETIARGGKDLAAYLSARGLGVATSQAGRNALQSFLSRIKGPRLRMARSLGWTSSGMSFVLPDGIVGAQSNRRFYFDGASSRSVKIGKKGTLEGWQSNVLPKVKGNRLHVLMLSSAFASPLLRFVSHANSFAVHILGRSSTGKSTALDVYGSVWGGDTSTLGFAQSWRTTTNGLEGLCALHSGVGLTLDELRLAMDDKGGGDVTVKAYMVGSGSGKTTMSRERQLKETRTWQLVVGSTGEASLGDMARLQDKEARDPEGARARLLDVPIDHAAAFGAFDTIHVRGKGLDMNDSSARIAAGGAFAKDLKTATRRDFGYAGPAFIAKLLEFARAKGVKEAADGDGNLPDGITTEEIEEHGIRAVENIVRNAIDSFVQRLDLPPDVSPLVRRVADEFGIVYCGGALAALFGVLPGFTKDDIDAAISYSFRQWLSRQSDARGSQSAVPALRLRDWLQQNEGRFVDLGSNAHPMSPEEREERIRMTPRHAGYKRDGWFAIMPSIFTGEVCGKSSDTAKELLRWLREGDYLKAKSGRDQFRLSLGAHNNVMTYYVAGVVRNLKEDGTLHEEDQRSHDLSSQDIDDQINADEQPKAKIGKMVVNIKEAARKKPRLMGNREQRI